MQCTNITGGQRLAARRKVIEYPFCERPGGKNREKAYMEPMTMILRRLDWKVAKMEARETN